MTKPKARSDRAKGEQRKGVAGRGQRSEDAGYGVKGEGYKVLNNKKNGKNKMAKNKKTQYKHVAIANLTSGVLTGGACAAGIVSIPFLVPLALTSLGTYGTIDYLMNVKKELLWDKLFYNVGLENKDEEQPQLIESIETSYGMCHQLTCPTGLGVGDFEKKTDKIETFLNCKKIKIGFRNKRIFIRAYEKEMESKYPFVPCADGILPFPVGMSLDGAILEDLAKTKTCHLFICGETGSGKSTALNVFLCNLILTKTHKQVELYIADGKGGSELWDYENCRHTKYFAKNLYEICHMMNKVKKIMGERQKILRMNRCKNIDLLNKKLEKKMSRIVVVFDEINIVKSAMTKEDKEIAKIIMANLSLLCQQARSTGITLALCTQLPYADLVGGLITGNVPLKLGFKVEKPIHSQMIVGNDELIELKGEGHGIVKIGMDKREFQGYYIEPESIEELLQGTYEAKDFKQIVAMEKKKKKKKQVEKPKNENKNEGKNEDYKKGAQEIEEVKDQGDVVDTSFLNKFK